MASEFRAAGSDHWSVCPDAAALAAALDGRGRCEFALLRALGAGYGGGAAAATDAAKSGCASDANLGAREGASAAATDAAKLGCAADAKLGARKGANIGGTTSAVARKPTAKSGAEAAASKAGKSRMPVLASGANSAARPGVSGKTRGQQGATQPATALPISTGTKASTAKHAKAVVPCKAAAADKPKAGKKRGALEAATNGRAIVEAAQEPSCEAAVRSGTPPTGKHNMQQERLAVAEVQQTSVGGQADKAPAAGVADVEKLCNGDPPAASMSGKRQRKQIFDSLKF